MPVWYVPVPKTPPAESTNVIEKVDQDLTIDPEDTSGYIWVATRNDIVLDHLLHSGYGDDYAAIITEAGIALTTADYTVNYETGRVIFTVQKTSADELHIVAYRPAFLAPAAAAATDDGDGTIVVLPSESGGVVHYDYIVDATYSGSDGIQVLLATGSSVKVYKTVQAAVEAAEADGGNRSIRINSGAYSEDVTFSAALSGALWLYGEAVNRVSIRSLIISTTQVLYFKNIRVLSLPPELTLFAFHSTNDTSQDRDVAYLSGSSWVKSLEETIGFELASGSYFGNGGTKAISGLGFTPKVVVVKANHATNGHAKIRSDTMSDSKDVINSTTPDQGIASLDSDGFTVTHVASATGRTNEAKTYYWYALGGAGVKTGTYVGNSTDNRGITGVGFQPVMVWIRRDTGGSKLVWRTTPMGTEDYDFGVDAGSTTRTKSLDADGFTLGADSDVNGSAVTYHYLAFASHTQLAVGTYQGNASDNRNLPTSSDFRLQILNIKGNLGEEANFKVYPGSPSSQSTQYGSVAAVSNRIQSLTIGDGQFQIGTDTEVNSSAVDYYFFAAGKVLVTGVLSWVKAPPNSGLMFRSFAVLDNGDSGFGQPGPIERSDDGGITWTEVFSVVTIFGESWGPVSFDYSLNGTYWVACMAENQLSEIYPAPAVYKSVDGGVTWSLVYEDATMEGSSRRRMISISCHPINSAIITVVGDGATGAFSFSCRTWYTVDGGATWTVTTGASTSIDVPQRIHICTSSSRLVQGSGGGGAIYVSDDYGATWTNKAPDFDGYQYDLKRAWNGVIYQCGAVTGNAGTVRRSVDDGDTWVTIYTAANDPIPDNQGPFVALWCDAVQDVIYGVIMDQYFGIGGLPATWGVFRIADASTVVGNSTLTDLTYNLPSLFAKRVGRRGICQS